MLSRHSTATTARPGFAATPCVAGFVVVCTTTNVMPCVVMPRNVEQQGNLQLIDTAAAVQERTG